MPEAAITSESCYKHREGRIKRANDLAESISSDETNQALFLVMVQHLPKLSNHFDADYVTIEAAAEADF
ncbi:hypothetical protein PR048_029753 [Dryococelus australis]|uniref:Uncharacterized protein n=1 Tax=Dryococelus australis TaxID=614101 RepID=A0ABQ9GE91_9NEOP|nr:hypothetical protein PR048_029753 [Dryococelus australis]